MEKTVWGDLLFLVNFCMDFQCLFLTAKLLHRRFFAWRAALASALGALYAVAALFFQTAGGVAFLLDCLTCFFMCLMVFFEKRLTTVRVFLPFLVYFGVSFATGGAMSAMASLLSHVRTPLATEAEEISSGLFFLLAVAGGASTFLWARFTARRAVTERGMLRVGLLGKKITLNAMVDTGNLLTDPVGGKPVVMVRQALLLQLAPAFRSLFEQASPVALATLPHELSRRVRLLHAQSAVGEKLLYAIVPDFAYLASGRGEEAVEVLLAPAALALGFDECEALLPAEMMRRF